MSTVYTFLNQDFVPSDKACLHISDLAFQRGYGIFDFFRVMEGYPLFIDDYLKRFYGSATEMQLEVPYTQEKLKEIIFELIRRNDLPMSGLKLMLTGGYSPDAFHITQPNLVITQQPLSLSQDPVLPKGIKIITHAYVRDSPRVKTINYITGIWLQNKISKQGASDVLYHQGGEVSELPRCNFFIVKPDKTLVTPSKNILYGITRQHVLELAAKKFNVQEGVVTLQDVMEAQEAFLTSTTKRILPITHVDNHLIGTGEPGAVAQQLYMDLIQLEKEELAGIR